MLSLHLMRWMLYFIGHSDTGEAWLLCPITMFVK